MNLSRQILRFPKNLIQPFSIAACQPQPLPSTVPEPDKLYKFLELELRGNDPAVLRSFTKFAVTAGNHFDLQSKSWSIKKPQHDRYTVLKSVHIHKKHRVQYEFRTYFAHVQYKHLTGSTAETLLEYVQRNLPEGVALKSTKGSVSRGAVNASQFSGLSPWVGKCRRGLVNCCHGSMSHRRCSVNRDEDSGINTPRFGLSLQSSSSFEDANLVSETYVGRSISDLVELQSLPEYLVPPKQ